MLFVENLLHFFSSQDVYSFILTSSLVRLALLFPVFSFSSLWTDEDCLRSAAVHHKAGARVPNEDLNLNNWAPSFHAVSSEIFGTPSTSVAKPVQAN
jgi:hypothetical protein